MKIKSSTKYVVLNDCKTPNVYSVQSQHLTEKAANKRCNTLAKNGLHGHTLVVPIEKLNSYKIHLD